MLFESYITDQNALFIVIMRDVDNCWGHTDGNCEVGTIAYAITITTSLTIDLQAYV